MPLTPDRLQAAADRVRRYDAGESPNTVYPGHDDGEDNVGSYAGVWYAADRRRLSDACLADHPADGGEPIDAAWMACAYGAPRHRETWSWDVTPDGSDETTLSVWPTGGRWSCAIHGPDSDDSGYLPDIATRGQLRRLLAALGVPPAMCVG